MLWFLPAAWCTLRFFLLCLAQVSVTRDYLFHRKSGNPRKKGRATETQQNSNKQNVRAQVSWCKFTIAELPKTPVITEKKTGRRKSLENDLLPAVTAVSGNFTIKNNIVSQ
uniref:Putative secreted protein n=1 Tax=Ixodes ricinus TaxID=34613 RepID=A0A6B0UJQ2_IXORI